MIYSTKGEFIQALKDYNYLNEKAKEYKEEYHNLYYLRYEKVKSPLDYDVVGYENGEQIRQIKSGGSFNSNMASDRNESLDEQMQLCLDQYSNLRVKIENVECELTKFKEPLKDILKMRYIEHRKLKVVCKKYNKMCLDEAGMYKYIQRGLDRYYE